MATPAKTAGKAKAPPDWERIENDYRAGILSLREIASQHTVSHVAITKRAKKEGWTRDLQARIQAKAEEMVTKAAVTKKVNAERRVVTDKQLVEANAEAIVQVRMAHRADIRRARDLSIQLLAELEQQTVNLADFIKLGELLYKPDEKGVDKLNDAYHKAISLPGRVTSMKALAETLKNLVGMEREAWGLAQKPEGPTDNPLGQLLSLIHGNGSTLPLTP